jgi:hypothetical protein
MRPACTSDICTTYQVDDSPAYPSVEHVLEIALQIWQCIFVDTEFACFASVEI